MMRFELITLVFGLVALGWFMGIGTALLVDRWVSRDLPKIRKEDLWPTAEPQAFTIARTLTAEEMDRGVVVMYGDPSVFDWDFFGDEEE